MVVTFHIQEGEKIVIEEFLFEGNSVFSSRTLQRQLTLKTKGIIADGAFQEAKLSVDREALIQYYHDRGYIDANVVDVVRETRKDEKGNNNMTITFRIYEGQMYNFGGVSFEGNKIFSTEQLSAQIYSKVGEIVNEKKIQADLMRVSDLYYENGYIFNRIEPIVLRESETGIVSYKIEIVERGRAHIENIIVRGNVKTKDEVILREIPLEAGDIFSKTKVMDGLRNLYNLQFFSNIVPETPIGSTDNLMDLVINVEEQPTIELSGGATLSGSSTPNSFPLAIQFKASDRNFLGNGNTISAEVNAAMDTQTLSLGYTQLWLFGLPLSGGFDFTFQHTQRQAFMDNAAPFFNGDETYAFPDGFSSYEEYEAAYKSPSSEYLMTYEQISLSFGFSTGYRWLTALGNLGLSGSIRAGWVLNHYDDALYRAFDPVLRHNNRSFMPALSVSLGLSLDQRDIYYDPSNGYYISQRFGYYGILPPPIEREHYMKTDTKAEYFFTFLNIPVSDNFSFKAIFGIHSGLSFILPQPWLGSSPEIEQANMLSVDGMFTGRGWTEKWNVRGLALWENWAEIRMPIVPGMLALDLFFDAAAVKQTPAALFTQLQGADMLYSFGGGLRITLPNLPLRLMLGKGFTVENGAVKWKTGTLPGGLDFILSINLPTY
jgi:outer membrane protein insertion porin family